MCSSSIRLVVSLPLGETTDACFPLLSSLDRVSSLLINSKVAKHKLVYSLLTTEKPILFQSDDRRDAQEVTYSNLLLKQGSTPNPDWVAYLNLILTTSKDREPTISLGNLNQGLNNTQSKSFSFLSSWNLIF